MPQVTNLENNNRRIGYSSNRTALFRFVRMMEKEENSERREIRLEQEGGGGDRVNEIAKANRERDPKPLMQYLIEYLIEFLVSVTASCYTPLPFLDSFVRLSRKRVVPSAGTSRGIISRFVQMRGSVKQTSARIRWDASFVQGC